MLSKGNGTHNPKPIFVFYSGVAKLKQCLIECTHNTKLMVFVLKSNCSLKWRVNKSNTNLKYSSCFCRRVFMFYTIC